MMNQKVSFILGLCQIYWRLEKFGFLNSKLLAILCPLAISSVADPDPLVRGKDPPPPTKKFRIRTDL
jgi:hypothetical protein